MNIKWKLVLGFIVLSAIVGLLYGFAADGGQLSTVNRDRQETSFGDLTADSLCASANTTIGLVAAVSFKPGTIPAQNPTREQIASLLQTPKETWAVSRLTGAQIRKALERSLSRLPLPNTAFLQLSGLTVVYAAEKPRGQRIVSLKGSGGPIHPDQHYEVVMPLLLAQGGSGYFQTFGKDDLIRRGSQGLADLIHAYRQAHPDKVYTGQGRLLPSG